MANTFIGIDVHLSRLTVACLDENIRVHFIDDFTMGELIERIMSISPEIIGVDAPLGLNIGLMDDEQYRKKLGLLSDNHHNKKVSEYELTKRGIFLYPSPKSMDEISGWKSWMGTGFQLYEELKKIGYLTFSAKNSPAKMMVEVFPHASFTTLAGRLLENKSTETGINERIRILERVGISAIKEYMTGSRHDIGDRLDAIAAAYTAFTVWNGNASFVGDPEEGVIALPVKALKDKYSKGNDEADLGAEPACESGENNDVDSSNYSYRNVDAVVWFKYFTPVDNSPSIYKVINFRDNPGIKVTLKIKSQQGYEVEATFEAMKNRVDGMKVIQEDKAKLKEFWGSHGDRIEYRVGIIRIVIV